MELDAKDSGTDKLNNSVNSTVDEEMTSVEDTKNEGQNDGETNAVKNDVETNDAKNDVETNDAKKENDQQTPKDNTVLKEEEKRRTQRATTQLRVKNLPDDITAEELKSLSKDIISCNISGRYGLNKQGAFLQFASLEKVEENLTLLQDKEFKGRTLVVDYAGGLPKESGNKDWIPCYDMKTLKLEGLPIECTVLDIAQYFPKCDLIELNRFSHNKTAKIRFEEESDASEAFLQNKNVNIKDLEIPVLHAFLSGAKKRVLEATLKRKKKEKVDVKRDRNSGRGYSAPADRGFGFRAEIGYPIGAERRYGNEADRGFGFGADRGFGFRGGDRDGFRGGDRDGFRGGDRDGFRGGDRDGFRGGDRDRFIPDRDGFMGGDRDGFRGGDRDRFIADRDGFRGGDRDGFGAERRYGIEADRGFGFGADRAFGIGADRGFGIGGDRGFGIGAERGYGLKAERRSFF